MIIKTNDTSYSINGRRRTERDGNLEEDDLYDTDMAWRRGKTVMIMRGIHELA